MLVKPRRRKVLKYKKMKEVGLNSDKIQVLFILDESNLTSYQEILRDISNTDIQINVVNLFETDFDDRLNYFSESDLDWLFEVCEVAHLVRDHRAFTYDLKLTKSIHQLNKLKKTTSSTREDEVSIVLSHANTIEKREVLLECIESLRKKNQKIILASHINVDDDIIKLVDYFVYDKKNRLIEPHEYGGLARTWAYLSFEGYYHEWNYANHAVAVLDLMKNSIAIALSNNFTIAHLIHYDCIIYDDELLHKHAKILENKDIYHYFYNGYEDRMDGNFFSVNIFKFAQIIYEIKEEEDYIKYGSAIFEKFLKLICDRNDIDIKHNHIESLFYKNIIDKIKMINLQFEKEYSPDFVTYTYVVPSIKNSEKFIIISTTDLNVNYVLVNGEKFNILQNKANVFEINEIMLEKEIVIEFPQLEHKQILKNDIKFADCKICDKDIVNYFDLTTI